MSRLIDADALDEKLARLMFKYAWQAREERVADYAFCRGILMAAPTIDPESLRPHGRWIGIEYDGYADGCPVYDLWECSNCGQEESGEDVPEQNPYCRGCGAKMDLEEDDALEK